MKKIKKYLRKLCRKVDMPIYAAAASWPFDEQFNVIRRRVAEIGITGIPDDRCFTLYKAAKAAASLPGELAECGCRRGKSTHYILAATGVETGKTIHIFDSFEGLSEPDQNDHLISGDAAWEPGELATDQDMLVNNLKIYNHMLSIHKGWIPDRFVDIKDKVFSLVHIDVDLYQPTLDSLKFFYDKMTPGGIIICDDYGSVLCPGAKKAFDEFFSDKPELLLELPSAQAIVVKSG